MPLEILHVSFVLDLDLVFDFDFDLDLEDQDLDPDTMRLIQERVKA